jgi:hypothetical protein
MSHTIKYSDKRFFELHPKHKLRIRKYEKGEFGVDQSTGFFTDDGSGNVSEVNIVIVRQIHHLHHHGKNIRNNDKAITSFLAERGLGPDLNPLKKESN